MSKICGYSCEHNKSGVCQISVCDKKSHMSDKTEVQTFTRYIDPTITELQQENKQLKEELECTIGIVEHNRIISEKNEEIHQLKDNWNKLKEHVAAEWYSYDNDSVEFEVAKDILNKTQELEQGSDK